MPMAAEDVVWIRQARTSITRTRRLEELVRLEAMVMACVVGGSDEICGGWKRDVSPCDGGGAHVAWFFDVCCLCGQGKGEARKQASAAAQPRQLACSIALPLP
jgi:hypothetical protein